jgi:DNA-binding CsgD family transcriptional regulator
MPSRKLLEFVTSADITELSLEERRRRLIDYLSKNCAGNAIWWQSGRGRWSDGEAQRKIVMGTESTQQFCDELVNNPVTHKAFRQSFPPLDHDSTQSNNPTTIWNRRTDWGPQSFRLTIAEYKGEGWSELCVVGPRAWEPDWRGQELIETSLRHIHWLRAADEDFYIVDGLSQRQRTILSQLVKGNTRKEIAVNLGLSYVAVNDYCKELYLHYDVNTATQLVSKVLNRLLS